MMRSWKERLLRVPKATGLFRWMRRHHRHELLVLTYHSVVKGVQEHRRRHPLVYRNAVDADRFERQMRYLKRHYRLLDGADLRAVLEGASSPERAVLVTFDDGLLNNKTVALPILRRLDVPAVFFLPTGFLDAASDGRLRRHWSEGLIAHLSHQVRQNTFDPAVLTAQLPGLEANPTNHSPPGAILRIVDHLKTIPHAERTERLTTLRDALGDPPPPSAFPADPEGHSILTTMPWDDARTAATHGITLGAHTVNHESLSRVPDEQAATEIEDSLTAIADHTDQAADIFSYPYGSGRDFDDQHKRMLSEAGCRGAFTQIVGFNDTSTDPLALRRIDVSPNYDLAMFAYVVSGTKLAVDRVVRRR
jgi:peptidoglycan/xylan/chitin deacetylase (PgdA/CDA1 family)